MIFPKAGLRELRTKLPRGVKKNGRSVIFTAPPVFRLQRFHFRRRRERVRATASGYVFLNKFTGGVLKDSLSVVFVFVD